MPKASVFLLAFVLAGCSLMFDGPGPSDMNQAIDGGEIDASSDEADAAMGFCTVDLRDETCLPWECVQGSDCSLSGVCDALTHQCVETSEVIYLYADVADPLPLTADSCTRDNPCGSFAAARSILPQTSRRWVAFLTTGGETTFTENLVISQNDTLSGEVTLYADGTELHPLNGDQAIIEVTDAAVRVMGMRLRGNNVRSDTGYGIRCVAGCELVVADSYVLQAGSHGVFVRDSSAVITRSRIQEGQRAGVHSTDSDLVLANSIIAGNGNEAGADAGGVRIQDTLMDLTGNTIRLLFNTIIDNQADPDTTSLADAGGVRCINLLMRGNNTVEAIGNIVQDNTGDQNVWDSCVFDASVVEVLGEVSTETGVGNGTVTSPVALDSEHELQLAESPAVNVSALMAIGFLEELSVPFDVDVDGTRRLVGAFPDMGAQERLD